MYRYIHHSSRIYLFSCLYLLAPQIFKDLQSRFTACACRPDAWLAQSRPRWSPHFWPRSRRWSRACMLCIQAMASSRSPSSIFSVWVGRRALGGSCDFGTWLQTQKTIIHSSRTTMFPWSAIAEKTKATHLIPHEFQLNKKYWSCLYVSDVQPSFFLICQHAPICFAKSSWGWADPGCISRRCSFKKPEQGNKQTIKGNW